MARTSILSLPRELIARIGNCEDADVESRNALRLAHRHFAGVHEDRTNHEVTFCNPEQVGQARQRLEACLRLKPQLSSLLILIEGLQEADLDLSLVQHIQAVDVGVKGCGVGLRITGLTGKRVHMNLLTDSQETASPELVQFMRQQDDVLMYVRALAHGHLLLDQELMHRVSALQVYARSEDDGAVLDFSLARSSRQVQLVVSCDKLHVTGTSAITEISFQFSAALQHNNGFWHTRAWLNAQALQGTRLTRVICSGVLWPNSGLQTDAFFVKYLMDVLKHAAPTADLLFDVRSPVALQFLRSCLTGNAPRVGLIAGGHNDWYLCARIAQSLLACSMDKQVPIHYIHYKPPKALEGLATMQQLYQALENEDFKAHWHMAAYWPT